MPLERWLYKVPLRLRSLFRSHRVEQELDDELQYHLECKIAQGIAGGLSPEQARHAALRAIGGLDQRKEECRDARGFRLLEDLAQDVRYGLRQLRRSPGFAAMAIITLALGIAATTAVFSLVSATLFGSLPYKDADRIVRIARIIPQASDPLPWTPLEYNAWRESTRSCNVTAVFEGWGATLAAGAQSALRVEGAGVSADFFPLLGVQAAIGRTPSSSDPGPGDAPPVVISRRLFESRFGGNRGLIGQTLRFDGLPLDARLYTLVGVMPSDFQFPPQADFWIATDIRNIGNPNVIARMAPGASIPQVKAEFDAVLARVYADPKFAVWREDVKSKMFSLREQLIGNVGISLVVLLGAVGLAMLIACINVANLLLLRNQKRRHEMSVRAAIGATRSRLARQMLAESGLLALLGGALAILLAWWMIRVLPLFAPQGMLPERGAALDARVLLFAIFITALTSVLVALPPALRQPWWSLAEAIKRSGGQESTADRKVLHSLLVSAQMALTLVVLCGAGLMIRSFILLRSVYPSMRSSNVMKFEVNLGVQYKEFMKSLRGRKQAEQFQGLLEGQIQQAQFFDRVVEEICTLPEVKRAAVTSQLPGGNRPGAMGIEDPRGMRPGVIYRVKPENSAAPLGASPGYFEIMGMPLIAGRDLSPTDKPDSPAVVVINRTLARKLYPSEDPVGKRLQNWLGAHPRNPVIVGVVGDVRNNGFRQPAFSEVYYPIDRPFSPMTMTSRMSVVVETRGSARPTAASIRAAVARVDPDAPITGLMTMEQYIESFIERDRFSTLLLTLFGVATLVLAAVGVYSVIAQSVEQRMREMAVRIAVGARPSQVMWLVLGRGAAQIGAGLAAGLIGAFFVTRTMRALLVEIKPYDPATFAGVLLLLVAVAFLACYGPARHATKVDPLSILRAE